MKIWESVEGLTWILTYWIYLSKWFWYNHYHHQHYYHCRGYHDHHTIAIITIIIGLNVCTYTHNLYSVGCGQLILLENMSLKIQCSTFAAQSNIVIVNTMIVRHCELSLRWVQYTEGWHYYIDQCYDFCHNMPPNTRYPPSAWEHVESVQKSIYNCRCTWEHTWSVLWSTLRVCLVA